MKILLSQRLPCFPALTGAAKSTLHLMKALAERGHSCRVVALENASEQSDSSVRARTWSGVEIHTVGSGHHLWTHLSEQLGQFEPSCVFIGEDPSYLGLATALQKAPAARVVYLAQSQATLPFGPESFQPDIAKTDMLARAAGIVAVSRYVRDYILNWGGLAAEVLPQNGYGEPPFPDFGNFGGGFVTLVNASQLKGLSIFEALASARPHVAFKTVPTWATTTADRERLRPLGNVRVCPPSADIDDVLRDTRVLLVPSLWGEAFGRIVVEAMLRGIPVMASDIGGLPEAKLGVDYLLPVRPIRRYSPRLDEHGLPIPIVPDQDAAPWLGALDRLLSERQHYVEVSRASRAAAMSYVAGLTMEPWEEFLQRIAGSQRHEADRPMAPAAEHSPALSRERLALVEMLVTERKRSDRTRLL